LSFFEIIVLGIIQGITEFFPVSSSGHLVIFQFFFGIHEPQIIADIMLHVGTLISLVIFMRREILELIQSFLKFCLNPKKNVSDSNIKLLFSLVVATLPTACIGYFFSDLFESLFSSIKTVAVSLIMTGFFLFFTKLAKEKKKDIILHPFLIGILQGIAIVPGFSRSGLTIGGALFLGWKRKEAAKFSFLLSIPIILGATLYQLQKAEIHSYPWALLLTGVLTAAAFGYLALKLLLNLVNKGKFFSFSFYCFFVGAITVIFAFL